MSIVPKTTLFNIKIDPYLDRYDAARHDVSLAIFERALKNSNPPAQPTSILVKTVGLLLTDLIARVMHIFSYLLRGLFYLVQLQGDKTKYYFYSALIWGPLTLFTKTASNCSRLFGCIVGFANPNAAVGLWLIAEIIDAFILKNKIAYTPLVSSDVPNPTEILGNAALFFGKSQAETIYQSVQTPTEPNAPQPSRPPLVLKLKNGKIRDEAAHFLKYLGQDHYLLLQRIFAGIPKDHPIYLNVYCLQLMYPDTSTLYQFLLEQMEDKGVYRYCLSMDDIIRMHCYIREKLQSSTIFGQIKENRHYQSLEKLLAFPPNH